jgi:hypothetical protein
LFVKALTGWQITTASRALIHPAWMIHSWNKTSDPVVYFQVDQLAHFEESKSHVTLLQLPTVALTQKY